MFISRLEVENFKGIGRVELEKIPRDIILVTGPNGSGKTSLLEAIALFNTSFSDEFHLSFLDERILHEKIKIRMTIELSTEEERFLCEKGPLLGEVSFKKNRNKVKPNLAGDVEPIKKIFDYFDRKENPEIGYFEYFGPQLNLPMKPLHLIDPNYETPEEAKLRRVQNYEDKANTLKNYLVNEVTSTLREFKIMWDENAIRYQESPDFLGPTRNMLQKFFPKILFEEIDFTTSPFKFTINSPQGKYDIDSLSTGEKVILVLFSEILRRKTKNSVILLDEMEINLDEERIEKFLTETKEISRKGNQLFIATKSDKLIEMLPHDKIFLILRPQFKKNQMVRLFKSEKSKTHHLKISRGKVSIISDKNRIILVGQETQEDKEILESLYEDVAHFNKFISGSEITLDEELVSFLKEADINNLFFIILGRFFLDTDSLEKLSFLAKDKIFVLDSFHIQNYLLEEEFILRALKLIKGPSLEIKNEKEITSLLKKASKETIPKHLNLLRKHQGNTKGSKSIKEKLEASLMGKSENWKKLFKGNFVLKKFSENVDVDKKELTETILKEMKRDGYIPAPVEKIIGRIH